MREDFTAILGEIAAAIAPTLGEGRVASYIPALARADPRQFAMALTTVDGEQAAAGAADERFTLQSISKIFTLTLALERSDGELWRRVGREPSGSPFNSLVQLEYEQGIPRNPLINAGALVTTDALVSHAHDAPAIELILAFLRARAASAAVDVDQAVARSERETGARNAAMAHFLQSFGNLHNDVQHVLDTYFAQCAIAMNCRELSRAMLYLCAGGEDPLDGRRIVSAERAKRINSLMLTCGHYDASGDFAFRVGLPGKSGVAGGIVAVVPRRLALAVWSPALDAHGNSVAGTRALELFAARTGCSVF